MERANERSRGARASSWVRESRGIREELARSLEPRGKHSKNEVCRAGCRPPVKRTRVTRTGFRDQEMPQTGTSLGRAGSGTWEEGTFPLGVQWKTDVNWTLGATWPSQERGQGRLLLRV